jgi:inorganic triphosphatase YgiF
MMRRQAGKKYSQTLMIAAGLNRGSAVTDEWKSAWQKPAIRCKGLPVKSVCREWLRALLAAEWGPVYRLRTNRCVQACKDFTAGAFSGKLTDDNRNCAMPRQFT